MTIKQYGGVFGRNPTFNDVNATDITTTNLNATDIDATNVDTGTLHVSTNLELTPVSSTFGTAPALTHFTNGYMYITGGASGLILRDDGGAVGIQIQNDDYIKFETGSPAAEAARFNSTGNLAFVSGKGIDFSATAGTGTSELLSDYEEGAFTATLTPATSGTITLSSTANELAYTKVGRQVFINGLLIVDSVSSPVGGSVKLNLPFTTANLGDGAGRSAGVSVQNTSGAYLLTPMYSFEGVVEAEIIFDASTVTAAHRFYISLSYITA
jgi:hypothetical protein